MAELSRSLVSVCSLKVLSPCFHSSQDENILSRYRNANEEDFLEEYPRLPPEANPLDPRFADPRVLTGEVVPNMENVLGMNGLPNDLWGIQGSQGN